MCIKMSKKLIIRRATPFLILLFSIIGAALLIKSAQKPQQKTIVPSLPNIEVLTVKPQSTAINLHTYGIVTPKHKSQLIAEVQGRIVSINSNFVTGAMVTKDQILAQIELSDYQTELIKAEAVLAQAKAALEEEIAKGKVAKIEFKDFNAGITPELGLRFPQLKKEQANVKFAQASLVQAKRNLKRTIITAPFSGIIRTKTIELGQYVTKGQHLGELYNTDVAEVRLPISTDDFTFLNNINHHPSNVILTSTQLGKKYTWQGKIYRSENIINPDNRMIYLIAEIDKPYNIKPNSDDLPLKFGTFVNAVIEGKTFDSIVKLPRYLVHNKQVAIIDKNNQIELRQLNIIQSDLESVYIKDSINNNERISLTPINNLIQGQQVNVINPSLNSTTNKHAPLSQHLVGDK